MTCIISLNTYKLILTVNPLMSKIHIINGIENIVKGSYHSWYIGITDNPDERKSSHGNTIGWTVLIADSENDAREIEKFFLGKGMKGDTGGGKSPNHVYIYRT